MVVLLKFTPKKYYKKIVTKASDLTQSLFFQSMEFLQNIEAERAGHCKGEVVDEHSISEGVCINSGRSHLI